jgi:hypothetical protein
VEIFFFSLVKFVVPTVASQGLSDGDTVFLVQTPLLCVWSLGPWYLHLFAAEKPGSSKTLSH